MQFSRTSALGAATLLLGLSGAAWAQTTAPATPPAQATPPAGAGRMTPGPGMGPGMGMPMMRGGMPMGAGMMGHGMMGQHVEGRIAFLKAEIGITEAQTAQWNAFAEALRANSRAMAELRARTPEAAQPSAANAPPVTLPQRIEQHERMATAHVEALRRLKTALTPLYAVLTEQQRQAADSLVMGMM
ncbi:Spy/CpxP family protein refolding chaperone [Roseomonas sp. PWR1]|uniref:Spy/CpxP family protein refolding chaperone n=1 Tax=Roseomonas nitratireducens TaxID=2820810 RepID=A0ABS4AQE7_9PROT|nr:Spy/CpxP family protein refolding chaperone [Neoroseomonas nitratireducens]MBP0463492.1 Spy/CpxP family protein refolding chaperone [Neoroseomonas nitratireducens]